VPRKIPANKETAEILADFLTRIFYDAQSGKFFRVKDRKELTGTNHGGGYTSLKLYKNKNYLAHRVAWALHYKSWPPIDRYVDHKNGNKKDNRIDNLRVVSNSDNAFNSKVRKKNKTGVPGVYKHSGQDKWIASITIDGRRKQVAYTPCIGAAMKARKAAELSFRGQMREIRCPS
jgi:hypothetical protein